MMHPHKEMELPDAPGNASSDPASRVYSQRFHIALDGNGANGLEGMAGVCLFLFDQVSQRYAYKIRYYDGIAAGHAVSVNPSGTIGFLGNAGQHLLFYDARTLDEVGRVSTLRYECPPSSLQGSTHLVWMSDKEFITVIGAHFYRFSIDALEHGERLCAHRLKLPHGMKRSASGRYIVYGSMDSPHDGRRGEACHVAILDLESMAVRVVDLPATCWHVAAHPAEDRFYGVSFRVLPQDHVDYHEWAMAFLKEYAFEIDAASGQVLRHWAAGREIPAHINSDVCLSDSELIFCNGGSQNVIAIDLATFASYRQLVDERPDAAAQLNRPREVGSQVADVFTRGNFFSNSQHFLGALQVSRKSLLDSIYGCQLSAGQSLLFTANRGLNHITIYDYPTGTLRLRVEMPPLQTYFSWMSPLADPRLGFHHAWLLG
ncbi:hypothetical protein [Massilia violaceinigra]|uniref:hypothetical protein n=1 Tax=Massilia violaceinigra TaxID=2045208 RepID=UPI001ABF458B|nr:hypothetical protein [Massilia violaceinigra]